MDVHINNFYNILRILHLVVIFVIFCYIYGNNSYIFVLETSKVYTNEFFMKYVACLALFWYVMHHFDFHDKLAFLPLFIYLLVLLDQFNLVAPCFACNTSFGFS